MANVKGITRPFLWGLIGLVVFLIFAFTMLSIMRALNSRIIDLSRASFWMVVYAIGIASSVWVQFSINAYFQLSGAYDTTYFKRGLGVLERNVWIPLMILSAAVAISTVMWKEKPWIHVISIVIYLLCAAGWDCAIWRLAMSTGGRGDLFKERCGQLFKHIDGPAVGVVTFWVALVFFWQNMRADGWRFATLKDLHSAWPKDMPSYDGLIVTLGDKVHMLCEPLLAGVIGFHMLLTVVLLYTHLYEWESVVTPSTSAAQPVASRGAPTLP